MRVIEEMGSNKKLTTDNIMKYLIIIMILFVTSIVITSILKNDYDYDGMVTGMAFIFILPVLKWLVKEVGIE